MFQGFSDYPSFEVFAAFAITVVLCLILMPIWKRFLQTSHIGQQVRADGPESHLVKQGTPTMGGVIMLVAVVLACLIIGVWASEVTPVLIAVCVAGVLGLVDDSTKVVFHRSLGLGPIAKLVCQFTVAIVFILYAVNFLNIAPTINIPFVVTLDLGVLTTYIPILGGISIPWLYLILVSILLVGMSNAVNLTDGLDGLAAGTCMIVMLVMAAIAYRINALGPSIVASSLAGACIGFLWFNSHPADIFMGDTGSLALGMALGCLAVITKTEFLSIIIGGLYVVEALSVMIQVAWFKKTGKRVFLMAPLHHHFEKKGWSETKVVIRFWIISGVLAGLGFSIFFAQTLIH